MSPDRFDLLERFESLFEATDRPLDGFLRRRDRKRRNQRISAGVVGIAVFVAVVWIAATGGPFGRTLTPANPGPTGSTVPPHPTGVGLLGLPPKGATPSTPLRGELVLSIGFGHTAGDPGRFSLHMYADGRVIWEWLGDWSSETNSTGLIEQRLKPEGIGLVLEEALSTGLFDRDRDFLAVNGLNYGGIQVHDGDRLARITWGDAGFEVGGPAVATTPTPEQVRAIKRLDARLEDLSSWLPASAWEYRRMRAYVPARYGVCYMDMGAPEPLGRPGILDLLPRSAEDLLRTLDTTQSYPNGFRGSNPFWCSIVTTQQARELARTLVDAGAFRRDPDLLSYAYWSEGPGTGVDIGLEPALPHD